MRRSFPDGFSGITDAARDAKRAYAKIARRRFRDAGPELLAASGHQRLKEEDRFPDLHLSLDPGRVSDFCDFIATIFEAWVGRRKAVPKPTLICNAASRSARLLAPI